MFDTLSKELYSLKQRSGGNVAEFEVHLSQQVQILQLECLERILLEHVEKIKWDHFYEGFNSEYRQMLAPKVDGENPAWLLQPISSYEEAGKDDRGQGPTAPKDSSDQCVECDMFSDHRESLPLA